MWSLLEDTCFVDFSAPGAPLLQPGTSAVLGVLAGTTAGLTGRTVARLAGLSHAGAAKVLSHLVGHGLVLVEPIGAAHSYRLNREHLLVGPALELLGAVDRLEEHLGTAIMGWQVPCSGCALFGSAARRDGSSRSDLDMLLLRPDPVALDDPVWRSQLEMTAAIGQRWSGNPLSWVEFDTATFAGMVAGGDPLVDEVRRDAHWLVPPVSPINALLRTSPRSA
jgi:hypothetical protein